MEHPKNRRKHFRAALDFLRGSIDAMHPAGRLRICFPERQQRFSLPFQLATQIFMPVLLHLQLQFVLLTGSRQPRCGGIWSLDKMINVIIPAAQIRRFRFSRQCIRPVNGPIQLSNPLVISQCCIRGRHSHFQLPQIGCLQQRFPNGQPRTEPQRFRIRREKVATPTLIHLKVIKAHIAVDLHHLGTQLVLQAEIGIKQVMLFPAQLAAVQFCIDVPQHGIQKPAFATELSSVFNSVVCRLVQCIILAWRILPKGDFILNLCCR